MEEPMEVTWSETFDNFDILNEAFLISINSSQ
jgi:hypothetical protein